MGTSDGPGERRLIVASSTGAQRPSTDQTVGGIRTDGATAVRRTEGRSLRERQPHFANRPGQPTRSGCGGPLPMIHAMESVAEQLKSLNARRILIRAAEQSKITDLRCAMEECYCPHDLGRHYFEPASRDLSDWMPTNDHYPTLACDGGRETVDNSRLAHRLCNRMDYSKRIGRSHAKDLARVEAARQKWLPGAGLQVGGSQIPEGKPGV